MTNQTMYGNESNHTDPTVISFFLVSQLISFGVIAVIAVLGNALICWNEFTRHPRKTSSYFIINLAITDLATGVLSIPLDIVERLSGSWPFFPFMCHMVYPFQTVLMAVSVITLLCMSFERHRAVVTPFKCKPTGGFLVRVIIALWVISVLLVIPYTLVLKIKGEDCVEDWPSQDYVKIYTTSIFIALYLLPLTLITICYTRTCLFMCKEDNRWRSMIRYYDLSARRVNQLSATRHKSNVKIIKVFAAAVMAFALCELPTHVIWLWHDFGSGSQWEHLSNVLPFCHMLTYLNSAIDPFIFGSLEAKTIRKKLALLLKRSKQRQGSPTKALSPSEATNRNPKRQRTKVMLPGLRRSAATKKRRTVTQENIV